MHLLSAALGEIAISMGCTSQAGKPCSCPALRVKEEPRDSNRDIPGLLDRGSFMSGARLWSDNLPWAAESRQNMAAVFAVGGGAGGLFPTYFGPGQAAGGHVPLGCLGRSLPFDKLASWSCSDLKIRIVTSIC